jgi:BON domain
MSRTNLLLAIAAVTLLAAAPQALAQGFGTSSGGFGSSSFGSGFGANSFGGGSSSFGALSPGAGTFGSGFGSNGTSGQFNSAGFGSTQMFGENAIGNGFSQGGFGQGFVGRDSSDMQALYQNMERGSNQFFNQLGRTLDRGSNRNRRGNDQPENQAPPIRVQLRMAPDEMPVRVASAGELRGRLEQLYASQGIGTPEVTVEGDVVTLRGTAPSESRRLVIEKLAELEPGVRQVWNLMSVAPTGGAPIPPQ